MNRKHLGADYVPPEDDVINVRSPTTVNHNYPAPVAAAPPAKTAGWLAPALIGAALTATGAGGAIGIPLLIKALAGTPSPAPAPVPPVSIPLPSPSPAPLPTPQTPLPAAKSYGLDFF